MRLVTCGFGMGGISGTASQWEGEGMWQLGTPPIVTTNQRHASTRCLHVAAASGSAAAIWNHSGGFGRRYFFRQYVMVTAGNPTAPTDIMTAFASTLNWSLELTTARRLQLRNGSAVALGPLSAVLGTGWHLVQVEAMIPSTGDGTIGWRLDDTEVHPRTTTTLGNTAYTSFRVGKNSATARGVVDTYHTDIAINDDQGTTPQVGFPGAGRTAYLLPTSDVARTGFTTSESTANTTNLWDAVDNVPAVGKADTALDVAPTKVQIRDAASSATDNYDAAVQSLDGAGIAASETITLVQPIASHAATATGVAGQIRVAANPVDANTGSNIANFWAVGAAGAARANYRVTRGVAVHAPTMTRSSTSTVRLGKRTASATVVLSDFMALVVEVAPPVPVTLTRTAADTVTVPGDTANRSAATRQRTAADTVNHDEVSTTRTTARPRTSADTVGAVTDAAVRSASTLGRIGTDTVTVTDLPTRTAPQSRTSGDTVTVTDQAVGTRLKTATSTDTVTVTDAATRSADRARTAADTVTVGDTATRTTGAQSRTSGDTVVISDSATRSVPRSRTSADTVTVTDTATRTFAEWRTATDTVTITDEPTRTSPWTRLAADSVTVGDFAVAVTHTIQYRTANDQLGGGGVTTTVVRKPIFIFDD